jgi:hypothetical protein
LWDSIAAALGGDEQLQPCIGAKSIFAIRAVVEVPQQSFTYPQGQLSVDQRPQACPDNYTLGIDRRSFGWALAHFIRF